MRLDSAIWQKVKQYLDAPISGANAKSRAQGFTQSGTFTVPDGVGTVIVYLQGAAGGGGGGGGGCDSGGGGTAGAGGGTAGAGGVGGDGADGYCLVTWME